MLFFSFVLECFANVLDILPLDVFDDHYLHFVEEVDGQVRQGVTQDRLLNEQYIAASFLDLLDNV